MRRPQSPRRPLAQPQDPHPALESSPPSWPHPPPTPASAAVQIIRMDIIEAFPNLGLCSLHVPEPCRVDGQPCAKGGCQLVTCICPPIADPSNKAEKKQGRVHTQKRNSRYVILMDLNGNPPLIKRLTWQQCVFSNPHGSADCIECAVAHESSTAILA